MIEKNKLLGSLTFQKEMVVYFTWTRILLRKKQVPIFSVKIMTKDQTNKPFMTGNAFSLSSK